MARDDGTKVAFCSPSRFDVDKGQWGDQPGEGGETSAEIIENRVEERESKGRISGIEKRRR